MLASIGSNPPPGIEGEREREREGVRERGREGKRERERGNFVRDRFSSLPELSCSFPLQKKIATGCQVLCKWEYTYWVRERERERKGERDGGRKLATERARLRGKGRWSQSERGVGERKRKRWRGKERWREKKRVLERREGEKAGGGESEREGIK